MIFTIFPRCYRASRWAELFSSLAKEFPTYVVHIEVSEQHVLCIKIEVNDGSAGSHFHFFNDLEEHGFIHGWQME